MLADGSQVYPLYEGKMLWHFDHRYGTYARQTEKQANKGVLPHVDDATHDDPQFRVQPRYWVAATKTLAELAGYASNEWFFAWRDVGPTERTFVGALIPRAAAGDTNYLLSTALGARYLAGLTAMLCSLVVDYDARQRAGRMKFFVVEQLALLSPESLDLDCGWLAGTALAWIVPRTIGALLHQRGAIRVRSRDWLRYAPL